MNTVSLPDSVNDEWLILLTIEHEDLPDSIRLVNRPSEIVSGDTIYLPNIFRVDMLEELRPSNHKGHSPLMRLIMTDSNLRIKHVLSQLHTPPHVSFEIVRSHLPNVIEERFTHFRLENIFCTTPASGHPLGDILSVVMCDLAVDMN